MKKRKKRGTNVDEGKKKANKQFCYEKKHWDGGRAQIRLETEGGEKGKITGRGKPGGSGRTGQRNVEVKKKGCKKISRKKVAKE